MTPKDGAGADDAERNCTVTYDEAAGCVVMTWRGYGAGAGFREDNERVLAALVEHRASRLLGEIERLSEFRPEDEAWLVQDWIPRAVRRGLRRPAIKLSPRCLQPRQAGQGIAFVP